MYVGSEKYDMVCFSIWICHHVVVDDENYWIVYVCDSKWAKEILYVVRLQFKKYITIEMFWTKDWLKEGQISQIKLKEEFLLSVMALGATFGNQK